MEESRDEIGETEQASNNSVPASGSTDQSESRDTSEEERGDSNIIINVESFKQTMNDNFLIQGML